MRFAQVLLLSVLVDEGTLREWLVNLGRREATGRVAHLMCELLARLRVVGLVSDDGYRLPITQRELADTTGISAVHANRVLQKLPRDGLITLRGKELVVLNVGIGADSWMESQLSSLSGRPRRSPVARDSALATIINAA